jgi:hypothetical protein
MQRTELHLEKPPKSAPDLPKASPAQFDQWGPGEEPWAFGFGPLALSAGKCQLAN